MKCRSRSRLVMPAPAPTRKTVLFSKFCVKRVLSSIHPDGGSRDPAYFVLSKGRSPYMYWGQLQALSIELCALHSTNSCGSSDFPASLISPEGHDRHPKVLHQSSSTLLYQLLYPAMKWRILWKSACMSWTIAALPSLLLILSNHLRGVQIKVHVMD